MPTDFSNLPLFRKKPRSITSQVVLGTASLGGVWHKVNEKESSLTILNALEQGIIRIDTAPAYGNAEEIVGKALAQWKGNQPLLSTKTGRLQSFDATEGIYDFSPEGIRKGLNESRKNLGTDTLNLVFIHDAEEVPLPERVGLVENLLELKSLGLFQNLGISGTPDAGWLDIIYRHREEISDFMGFNRLDASSLAALKSEIPFFREASLEYWAASPLHMGLLGNRYESYLQLRPEWVDPIQLERAGHLRNLASEAGISFTELAHRFVLSLESADHLVIGPSSPGQLKETLDQLEKGPLPLDLFQSILNLHLPPYV